MGANRSYFHLETPKLQEVLFSKPKPILTGKLCATWWIFKHRLFSFERYMCFFNSVEWTYLEQAVPISILKHPSYRKYSFQNLCWFSPGNNMLDATDSNIDGFPGGIHEFFQLLWIGLLGANRAYPPPWKLWFSGSITFKTYSILIGKYSSWYCCL
jgi:hypothetical protein